MNTVHCSRNALPTDPRTCIGLHAICIVVAVQDLAAQWAIHRSFLPLYFWFHILLITSPPLIQSTPSCSHQSVIPSLEYNNYWPASWQVVGTFALICMETYKLISSVSLVSVAWPSTNISWQVSVYVYAHNYTDELILYILRILSPPHPPPWYTGWVTYFFIVDCLHVYLLSSAIYYHAHGSTWTCQPVHYITLRDCWAYSMHMYYLSHFPSLHAHSYEVINSLNGVQMNPAPPIRHELPLLMT